MNKRIRQIRKDQGLTLEKFGAQLGVARSTISNIENGRFSVTDQMAKSICREFNVNPHWLETGKGDPYLTLSKQESLMKATAQLLKDKDSALVKAITNFIITYEQLDDSSKHILEDFLDKYLQNMAIKE